MTINCSRDGNGWRTPRVGTFPSLIYYLMREGLPLHEIHEKVGRSKNTVAVLMWKIRNPDNANKAQARWFNGS